MQYSYYKSAMGVEVKNFSYTCSLFKGNNSMDNKIIEYSLRDNFIAQIQGRADRSNL